MERLRVGAPRGRPSRSRPSSARRRGPRAVRGRLPWPERVQGQRQVPAARLTSCRAAGLALARFDFRGCGESSGVEPDTTIATPHRGRRGRARAARGSRGAVRTLRAARLEPGRLRRAARRSPCAATTRWWSPGTRRRSSTISPTREGHEPAPGWARFCRGGREPALRADARRASRAISWYPGRGRRRSCARARAGARPARGRAVGRCHGSRGPIIGSPTWRTAWTPSSASRDWLVPASCGRASRDDRPRAPDRGVPRARTASEPVPARGRDRAPPRVHSRGHGRQRGGGRRRREGGRGHRQHPRALHGDGCRTRPPLLLSRAHGHRGTGRARSAP